MTSYLSSRHHNETWVKDGYLQVDASPIDFAPLNTLMNYVTVKAGHFEINYGDAHFRRTDNGHSAYNPLVGNYIMDAFTTQVGTEVYLRGRGRLEGAFVMGGMTNGEVRGMTLNAQRRSPAYLTKIGRRPPGLEGPARAPHRVELRAGRSATRRSTAATAPARATTTCSRTRRRPRRTLHLGRDQPGPERAARGGGEPVRQVPRAWSSSQLRARRGQGQVGQRRRREFGRPPSSTYRLLATGCTRAAAYNTVTGRRPLRAT
jgi:hypothetical protein